MQRNCKIGSVFVSGLGRDYAQLIAIHFQVTQQLRNAVKSLIRDLYFSRCSFHLLLACSVSVIPNVRKVMLPGIPRANLSSDFSMSLCSISCTVSCRLCSMASSVSISVPSISNMICLYFLITFNLFDYTARIAHRHTIGRDGTGDNAACPDNTVPADNDSRQ